MAGKIKAAWRAYEKGDNELATSLFAEATNGGGGSALPHIQQALFFLKLDKFEQASEQLLRAREIDEKNPAPLFFLALSQELLGQRSESKSSLAELRKLESHHQGRSSLELLQAIRDGNPLEGLRGFGFGPEESTSNKVTTFNKILASLGMGNPEWLPSDLSSSSYVLGQILLEMESKLHPLEIPRLEHQTDFLPEDLDKFKPRKRSLGEELRGIRDSVKASPLLKKGKALLEKAFGMTDQEEQQKLLRRALVLLRRTRKIDKYAFRVSYHLGETYIFLAKKRPGEPYSRFALLQAQSSFLVSVQHEGINPYLLFYLAYIQHLLGRPHLAIKYYQAATQKFEKLPEAHYGEGQCQLILGNHQAARKLLLKAVNSDLALARERLDLYANLLAENGLEHFSKAFPELGPEPSPETYPDPETSTTLESEVADKPVVTVGPEEKLSRSPDELLQEEEKE